MSLWIEVLGTISGGGDFTLHPLHIPVSVKIADGSLVIGSNPKALPSLTLAHPTITREHVIVFCADGIWKIRDLGSDNGLLRFHFDGLYSVRMPSGQNIEISDQTFFVLGLVLIRFSVQTD
jgi:pSer/pThr/pTyr-binding forkhead associated (FHA) protein